MTSIQRVGDKVILKCDYSQKELAKSISHYKWNPKIKTWEYPFGNYTVAGLKQYFPNAEGIEALDDDLKPVEGWNPTSVNGRPPLFKHQIESIRYALKHPRCALLSDLGTAKTRIVIEVIDHLINVGQSKMFLIVCPLSMVSVWEDEFEEWSDRKPTTLYGSGKKRIEQLITGLNEVTIIVTNYEFVRNYKEVFQTIPWDMIVCDESSKIKNPTTCKITKVLWAISEGVRFRIIMNGVLTPNNPLEAFGQYRFLDPSVFGIVWNRFRYRYAEYGGFQGYEVLRYQNKDQFEKQLFSIAVRYLKADCDDIPSKLYQKRIAQLPPANMKIYAEMKDQMIAHVENEKVTAINVLVRLLRLQQISSGFVTTEDDKIVSLPKNPKFDAFFDLCEELGEMEAVVVFFRFLYSMKKVREEMDKRGWSYVSISGSTKMEDRRDYIHKFQAGNVRFFLGQVSATGLGLTLTASSNCVFYENPFSYGVRLQAEDRLHRHGQKHNVTYTDLVMKGTIDERVLKILEKKKDVISFIQERSVAALLD